VVTMAAISLRQQQQISPSGGGRRVPPPPPAQKIRVSPFCRNEGVHKTMETRRRSRAKRAMMVWSARWAMPPMHVWASWLLLCATTSPDASRGKILTL
jgi:hypothetical protein